MPVGPFLAAAGQCSPLNAQFDGNHLSRVDIVNALQKVGAHKFPGIPRMVIDSGLARGIRHGYMRQVRDAWIRFGQCWKSARLRNRRPVVDTPKSFRRACDTARAWLGPLLNVTEMQVSAGSKSAWLASSMVPHFDENALGVGDMLQGQVVGFLRPGGAYFHSYPVHVTGHALDRVIQRAGLVTTPLAVADIHAINAEFADLLHFAVPAVCALGRMEADEAEELSILLPSHHGFFLGEFEPNAKRLVVRTFVDESKLWTAEREALRELNAVDESELAVLAFAWAVPSWMGGIDSPILSRLPAVWKQLGWRLREEERPAGLSDRAWNSREAESSMGGSAAA